MNKICFTKVSNYLSLVKFAHTIFALPFAFIGYCISINPQHPFEWKLFLLLLGCMFFARNAAMAFNRFIDREYDKSNARTAFREIPSQIIKPFSALNFVIINSIIFVIFTGFINSLCLILSPVALLVILGYSYTKRFTSLSHLLLGLGLSLAPIGAYLAVTSRFDVLPLIFSALVLTWVAGFDIIYSLQDYEFDKSNGLKSIPAFLGITGALRISIFLHILSAGLTLFAGWFGNFGNIYFGGAFLFIGMLIYQHLLVKPNDLSHLNLAFFTTNGIASLVFAAFTITDIFLK
ncbi:MAG: putative 4-hydroxybenzoate polyprenyltransferase [Lentimicrobiaceae bacterium]|nr:putative 4-hydroxybenzoate polyprenyltransferase [Lentimicrobiaceae bacterium]